MADYHPLLAKAVATLGADTYEARAAVYERARKALIGQLRQMTPAVPEADIVRERKALDAAIEQLEREERARPKLTLPTLPVTAAPPPPSPPPSTAAAAPAQPALKLPPVRQPDVGRPEPEPVDLPRLRPANGRSDAVRPVAPAAPEPRTGNLRWWIVTAVIALVVGAIAGAALFLKQTPADLARSIRLTPSAPAAPPEGGAGKIVERIGGSGAGAPSTPVSPVIVPTIPVRPAPVQPAPTAQTDAPGVAPAPAPAPVQTQPAPAAQPGITVAYRAAILVDAPDDPQKVKAYVGTVLWSMVQVNAPGKPGADAVRAEIDIPPVKLRAIVTLQKNLDATLPASHTMEIRFIPSPDSEVTGVKAIKVPELRKEDTPSGDPLAGAPAPVIDNFFFVGLSKSSDGDVAKNLDLMTTRGWFDIPMLLSNDKIAKLTFEKGVAGDQVLAKAFEAWK